MSKYVSPEKEIMITLRLSKVPNSQSMIGSIKTYTVCETCMIDTTHESIIFPFIFIVKFSDRLLSSKMCFLGWGQGQEVLFNHLNRNDSSGTTYSAFSNFLTGHPVLWTLGYSIKKQKHGWGVGEILFWTLSPLEIFHFFTLPLKIPQNCVRSLGNSKAKDPCPGNFALFFLGHPWAEILLHF